jgi:hypothetical protein
MRVSPAIPLALALMGATAACTFGNYDGSGGGAEGGLDGSGPHMDGTSPPPDTGTPPKDGAPPSDASIEAMGEAGPPGLCDDIAMGGKCSLPGKVACGGSTCDVVDGGAECCMCGTCQPAGTCMGGPSIACKEAADCSNGLVCCLTSSMPPNAQCLSTCGPSLQLCRHNAECGAQQPCTVFTVSAGGPSCQREFCGTVGPSQMDGPALCGCPSLM